jgi:hypothetical protein
MRSMKRFVRRAQRNMRRIDEARGSAGCAIGARWRSPGATWRTASAGGTTSATAASYPRGRTGTRTLFLIELFESI